MGQSYNDSFSSFSSGGSGDSGGIFSGKDTRQNSMNQGEMNNRDVILTPSPTGERINSKKWVMILLVVLVVVTVGLGIAWMVIGNGSNDNSLSLPASFNKYANYLLYGKDSTEKIGRYDGIDFLYYFDGENINLLKDDSGIQKVTDYYRELTERLLSFNNKVLKSNLESSIKSDIEEYIEEAEDYFVLRQTFFPDELAIRQYYIDNGYDDTLDVLKQQFGDFAGSDHFTLSSMGDFFMELSQYYLNEYATYKNNGCVDGLEVNYSCPKEVVFEYSTSKNELETAIQTVMANLREEVLKGCWDIYEKIAE